MSERKKTDYKRPSYTPEFKAGAVRLIVEEGRAVSQPSKVRFEVHGELRAGLAVHAHGPVLAGPSVRLSHPALVHVTRQRVQGLAPQVPRQLRYPSLFR